MERWVNFKSVTDRINDGFKFVMKHGQKVQRGEGRGASFLMVKEAETIEQPDIVTKPKHRKKA